MAQNNKGLHYNIDLGETVEGILDNDFWVMECFTPAILALSSEPIKFSTSSSIFVKKGRGRMDLNLLPMEIEGPCIVNVGQGQILRPVELSDDFEASFLVLSQKMRENIFLYINDPYFFNTLSTHPVLPVEPEMVGEYEALYSRLGADFGDSDNPYRYQTVLHTLLAFLFRFGLKSYRKLGDKHPSSSGRMSERFLKLVRQHYKTHRFLEFYAEQLQVTPKHLSRTVKNQTGYTAVEWIERFIILEAQVLLKSSDLHIQQISDDLHFPSQSVFGKYFRKKTGMSPREFRNRKE